MIMNDIWLTEYLVDLHFIFNYFPEQMIFSIIICIYYIGKLAYILQLLDKSGVALLSVEHIAAN